MLAGILDLTFGSLALLALVVPPLLRRRRETFERAKDRIANP